MMNIGRFLVFGAAALAPFAFTACGGGGGGGGDAPAAPAYPESLSEQVMTFDAANKFIFAPADENGNGGLTGVRASSACEGSYSYVSGHLTMTYSSVFSAESGEQRLSLRFDGTISAYSANSGSGTFSAVVEKKADGSDSPLEALPNNFTLSAQ